VAAVGGTADTSPEAERAWFTRLAIALERECGLRVQNAQWGEKGHLPSTRAVAKEWSFTGLLPPPPPPV